MSGVEYRSLKRTLSWMMMLSSGLVLLAFTLVVGCGSGTAPSLGGEATKVTPTDDPIGERLFLDTRFSQYFATHMTGINAALATGDPVVATVSTPGGVLPGAVCREGNQLPVVPFRYRVSGSSGSGQSDVFRFCGAQPVADSDEWLFHDAAQRDADGGYVPASYRGAVFAF